MYFVSSWGLWSCRVVVVHTPKWKLQVKETYIDGGTRFALSQCGSLLIRSDKGVFCPPVSLPSKHMTVQVCTRSCPDDSLYNKTAALLVSRCPNTNLSTIWTIRLASWHSRDRRKSVLLHYYEQLSNATNAMKSMSSQNSEGIRMFVSRIFPPSVWFKQVSILPKRTQHQAITVHATEGNCTQQKIGMTYIAVEIDCWLQCRMQWVVLR